MALKDFKTRINEWIASKSEAERQKLKKNLIVIPGAVIIFLGSMWLIFGSYVTESESRKGKANMELPEGDSDGLQGNKLKALAEEALREEKARQDSVVQASIQLSDTIPHATVSGTAASPIEQSAQTYQEVQESLNDFFVEDDGGQAEIEALNERIAELEARNAASMQTIQGNSEMDILERSYQLAAQYMGNGNTTETPPSDSHAETDRRDVHPVTPATRNVVSALGATSARAFNTSVGKRDAVVRNTISAVVEGDQSVSDGQTVRLRITEPLWIGNRLIPRNTTICGTARMQGERLDITVSSVESEGSVYDVQLNVYDTDGQEGLNMPGSIESDALHEIGANMGSAIGSSINISTDAGAQIASDVGRGLINGVSQYLTKKMRTVKVHLKSGYRVMLYQPEDI